MGGRRLVGRAAAARALAALVVVLVVAGVGAGPASAAGRPPAGVTAVGTVPPQVQAAYDGELLRQLVVAAGGGSGQVRAGTVHQLFTFTQEFVEGRSTGDPVRAEQAWVAGYEVDGEPAGWQQTYLDDSGAVRSSGTNPDPLGARAFLDTTAVALVQVPSEGEFFTLVDGVVTPLRTQSWDTALGPRSLAQVQADFAVSRAETAAAYACCTPADACAGGSSSGGTAGGGGGASCGPGLPSPGVLALAAAAVLLAAGTGWTALSRRRCAPGGRS
ncbi:hypothetical protein ACUN7V_02990 [Quadrisphaera oryzae]|uniref:hypothetical protein n=1 Tax=Quadrisphaera TaxID=317661 RepID=UPI001648538B|nr:hypothetical protein [Quadrisphaera sp. RL12-1S]MBC3761838.1 hypothetical protein [Quadrisphaera sp. RL12-1S]